MDYQFTIIVPIYNEEDNILRLKNALSHYITIASKKTKVLFINDGSTDKSLDLITAICKDKTSFSFISFDKNYGLSAAIKAGFDIVDTALVGYMDSDLQTSPNDFNTLLKHIEDYDLVTGMRDNRQDSVTKKWSSKAANKFRRLFTNDGIDDTGCPLKVIKTAYAKNIPMFKGLHRFLPAMVLLQNGRIKQIPIAHFPRLAGQSKFGFWNRSIGPFIDCFVFLWIKKRYINYTITKRKL